MKQIFVFFTGALFLTAFSQISYAQTSATADASATIVTPISILKTQDMNFGKVAVSATTGGTVVLSPVTNQRTATGGVTLPVAAGVTDVTPAIFTVNGEGAYTFSITLPSTPVTIENGGNQMTLTAFTSDPSGTGTLASGTATLQVGATLNVAAAQPAGVYTTPTPFSVTVNYN